jgi:penicillin-binding protein 1A
MALPVWAIYMKKVFDDTKINLSQEDFDRPEGVTDGFDCTKISTSTEHLFDDEF